MIHFIKHIVYRIINVLKINSLIYYLYRFFCKPIDKKNIKKLNLKNIKTNKIFTRINNINIKYDLHIIVPCYNVEKFIDRCVTSILCQKTKYSFFVSFVNDGSTDNTLEKILKYKIYKNVEIINKKNGGLSSARNVALSHIYGRYLLFVDSDDYITEDAVEKLLSNAYQFNCDIVSGMYKRVKNGKILPFSDYCKKFVCGNLYRSTIFKKLIFPEGFLFEDTINAFLIDYKHLIIKQLNELIYFYTINPSSITHVYKNNYKSLDTYYMTKICMDNLAFFDINPNDIIGKFVHQVVINHLRLKFDENLSYNIFIEECTLYKRIFSNKICSSSAENKIIFCLKIKNFKLFKLTTKIFLI